MNKEYRKKAYFRLLFLAIIAMIVASFRGHENDNYHQLFRNYFTSHTDKLIGEITVLSKITAKKSFNPDSAKAILAIARMEYKSIEPFVIYFFPGDARLLNRVVISEMSEDDEVSALLAPHGFQFLEKMLYNDSVILYRKKINNECDEIYNIVKKLNESIFNIDFTENDIFTALQMQLIRQFMLGFANFETTDSKAGVKESKSFLCYLKECIGILNNREDANDKRKFDSLFNSIDAAVNYLNTIKPGNEPDYFYFYSTFYIPVSDQLCRARFLYGGDNVYNTTAVNYQVRSVFDPNAFNSFYFLPAKHLAAPADVVELGRSLFFDPALSANNLRACASCHQPGKGFTDGLSLSESFEPGKKLKRNAPTIINAVYQRKLFHDGRVYTFEDQAGQVMSNPMEMHNDFSEVAVKLLKSQDYVAWFRKVFDGSDDTIISSSSILTAIAEYERSLVGMNSRFDKTISGRSNEMNADEKKGFNLFMGKANCGSCHFIPLFNGTLPPEYVETEWEIIGVPSEKISSKQKLDDDIGRAGVVNADIFRHAFKTPTLRNVEITAPYMHNGVFKTLEEVIEFYNNGGGTGLGYDVPSQTLPANSLQLSATEKFQLVTFLKTLTDTVNITNRPESLPKFNNEPNLNNRPIGGEY